MTARGGEAGSGSVLVVVLAAVAVVVALALGVGGGAVVAAARAQTAADLAALGAGSAALRRGAAGCEVAERAAVRHGVRLVACGLDPDGSVRVRVVGPGPLGPVERRAHAGVRPAGVLS
ncbi:Rv3654c family TadE-like protein [Cellulomonas endophytica]|uniref:Rv3654c family TadE-like protein n=1 Tax=Cellulomonas endophytica TaxID=2494735 RepID=UPI0013E946BD|nr:Rv3654c family TadE-like protein [Cellulomonas endophytica]